MIIINKHMQSLNYRKHKQVTLSVKLRTFFTLSCLVFIMAGCQTTTQSSPTKLTKKEYFLIGNMSPNEHHGVTLISLDQQKLTLNNEGIIADAQLGSYIALTKNHKNLFTVIADNVGGVNHFKWHPEQQKYLLEQSIKVSGKGTCHVALNHDESQLVISNYRSGDVHLFDINKNNQHLTEIGYFKNTPKDQKAIHQYPRMHYSNWDNSGKYLYSVDLGTDEIKVFNSQNREFTPTVAAQLADGDGPRHLAFHPSQNIVYALNEFSSDVVVYQQDMANGQLKPIQRLTALPATYKTGDVPKIAASAIRISPDGKFLYAGVRGINAIAVFSIADNGTLNMIQSQSSLADWPRDLNFSAQANYLLVANKRANIVTVLARDVKTGLLSATDMALELPIPSVITNFNILK